eukprot:936857-Rhodomonas_salina.1
MHVYSSSKSIVELDHLIGAFCLLVSAKEAQLGWRRWATRWGGGVCSEEEGCGNGSRGGAGWER